MSKYIAPILAACCLAYSAFPVSKPHSIPSAPVASNPVAVPAADAPSSLNDGAADHATSALTNPASLPAAPGASNVGFSHISSVSPLPANDLSSAPSIQQMLAENNRIRAAAGRPPQTLDSRLCAAAQEQATWLGDHGYTGFGPSGHYFGNGDVNSRAFKQGFYHPVGENLGVGYTSVEHGFKCFKDSPGHYATLLGNFDVCGFGEAFNSAGQRIYVCVYGDTHAQAAPPVAASAGAVRYTQQVSTCGPNGCGPAFQPVRRIFGRRR